MRKIDKTKCSDGLTKEKKEILKNLVGSASSPNIDLNKVRDEWKYGQITEQEIELFMEQVASCLIQEHGFSQECAAKAVKESVLAEVIYEDAEVAMHYTPEYWADDIIEEIQKLNDDKFMLDLKETGLRLKNTLKIDQAKIDKAIKDFRKDVNN